MAWFMKDKSFCALANASENCYADMSKQKPYHWQGFPTTAKHAGFERDEEQDVEPVISRQYPENRPIILITSSYNKPNPS